MIRIFASLGLIFLTGCGAPTSGPGVLSLNWFPEAEHGGFFQAVINAKGEVPYRIESGGPDVPVLQKVATGKSDFGVVNADDVVNAQSQGADVVALMAPLYTHPRCIMLRKDSGVKSIAEIKNMTLAMSSRPAFSHWLQHKYPFEGVKVVPYPGSILPFTQDPKFGQQAYSISEPFLAKEKGVEPLVLMVSELGFNPYGSVLITRRELIEKDPERVRKVVVASQRGWQLYLQNGEKAHKRIHALNPEMGMDILAFGHKEMKKLLDPRVNHPFGTMVAERWQTLIGQMTECGLIKKDKVKPETCFTNQFLE
jgi:NitT/TauT family transport system substrate-binding protein